MISSSTKLPVYYRCEPAETPTLSRGIETARRFESKGLNESEYETKTKSVAIPVQGTRCEFSSMPELLHLAGAALRIGFMLATIRSGKGEEGP